MLPRQPTLFDPNIKNEQFQEALKSTDLIYLNSAFYIIHAHKTAVSLMVQMYKRHKRDLNDTHAQMIEDLDNLIASGEKKLAILDERITQLTNVIATRKLEIKNATNEAYQRKIAAYEAKADHDPLLLQTAKQVGEVFGESHMSSDVLIAAGNVLENNNADNREALQAQAQNYTNTADRNGIKSGIIMLMVGAALLAAGIALIATGVAAVPGALLLIGASGSIAIGIAALIASRATPSVRGDLLQNLHLHAKKLDVVQPETPAPRLV